MILAACLIPFAAGLLAFFVPWDKPRRVLLILTALAHAGLVAAFWFILPEPRVGGWFELDTIGKYFLSITSLLFLAAACYGVAYLSGEDRGDRTDVEEGFIFQNAPEAVFTGCLLMFLATMTLVLISQHFGILWIAMEATTLVSAPLIYFHRHHRSIEATWKYLLICSVGIALALLGNLFLVIAGSIEGQKAVPLVLSELIGRHGELNVLWLKAAFLFLLVGYGTKMGLAPLHTWLPDAHSEAPSVVSALLSGALLNCALVGILRTHQVCAAAGLGEMSSELLRGFGLLSMFFAALFILRQPDFKRMLAYSSVEHMGIVALGIGLGGSAVFGGLFHAVNHSLTKAALFFIAGNIMAAYNTKSVSGVQGLLRMLPVSGILWIAGFLAITGSPPFGSFLSEFIILKSALDQGHYYAAVIYLVVLAAIFAGMAMIFLNMAQGVPAPEMKMSGARKESVMMVFPPAVFCVLVLLLGIYIPEFLRETLREAARLLGGLG
ncbi:MAG: proton-conducting transporter membrane subunit [Candidatus Omnitrophica bacterium]|nr:proton-conducting transporter membrane subunit [Candidatus Omnitrophota bacterium]MDD5671091.1 proton-conducting transporter membrane subunit [Candidatus Omnitrophota bacterium]